MEREHDGTLSQNSVEQDPGDLGAPTDINSSLLLATRTPPQHRAKNQGRSKQAARTESEKKPGRGQGGGGEQAWATAISYKFAWSLGH